MEIKYARQFMNNFFTRGAAALGGVLFSLIVARLAGPEGLGLLAVFLSVLVVGALLARRGLDILLIRAVAKAKFLKEYGLPIRLFHYSLGKAMMTAFFIAIPVASIVFMGWLKISIPGAAISLLICIPMLTFLALISGFLKGVGRPWVAPLFEIGGISLLATLLIIAGMSVGLTLNIMNILLLFVVSMVLLCCIGIAHVLYTVPRSIPAPALTPRHRDELSYGQIEFTLIAVSTYLVQAGAFLLVVPYLSEQSLGLVRAAERLALIISFPVLVIEPFIAAQIVRYVQMRQQTEIKRLIVKAMLGGSAIVIPIFLFILIVPQIPLQWMGEEFVPATPYLRAMAFAHFVVVLLGPFIMVLNMGGGEKDAMWIALATLVTAFALYPVAASIWGAAGFVGAYVFLTIARSGWVTFRACRYISKLIISNP